MRRRKVHPATWIVLFFVVLFGLEASFILLASTLPDDRVLAGER